MKWLMLSNVVRLNGRLVRDPMLASISDSTERLSIAPAFHELP